MLYNILMFSTQSVRMELQNYNFAFDTIMQCAHSLSQSAPHSPHPVLYFTLSYPHYSGQKGHLQQYGDGKSAQRNS